MIAWAEGKKVQCRVRGVNDWHDMTSAPEWFFQTQDYRPKPEPKVRPWNSPADVPGPVCWLRRISEPEIHVFIVCVSPISFTTQSASIQHTKWGDPRIGELEYSTDRKEWKPCTCEVTE